jgi:hypothetical protein
LDSDVGGGEGSRSWLEVAKFLEHCLKWCSKLAAIVECGKFGLGCQQHDVFDDCQQCEYGAIVEVFDIAIL